MRPDIITEKLRALEPIIGAKKAQSLRLMYHMEDDYREKKQIEAHIDFMLSQHVSPELTQDIVLPPPKSVDCSGEIPLGQVKYLDKGLYPCALDLKAINRHVFIAGATGSGKTTLARHIIRELHTRKLPFLIVDWEKSYRNLCCEFDDVEVITVGQDINPLYLNPLVRPPGIETEEYIKSLLALMAEDYLSGAGSDTVLMECMIKAYEQHTQPTFENLKQIVLKHTSKGGGARGRRMLWDQTVERIISFLSRGAIGQVLGTKKHYPLEKLFTRNVVLEMGGVESPRDRKFITHVILNWLHLWTRFHGIHAEQLNQVVVFEEFHNITLKSKEDNLISNMFRESRKYGIGIIAIDQTPSEIPNAIFANANSKISFGLSTNQDIKAMAGAMNMPSFTHNYFSMLKTGEAIIHVNQRSPDPFVITVPLHENDKTSLNIADSELQSRMLPYSAIYELELSLSDEQNPSRPSQTSDTPPPQAEKTPPKTTRNDHLSFDPIEKLFFTDIAAHPFDGIDKRTKRLGLHPEVITALHQSHCRKGSLSAVTVDGRKLLDLTDQGKQLCEQNGVKVKRSKGRGGVEHTYWQHETVQSLQKQGFQPVMEMQDIDIVDPDMSLAIEIETGKSDIKKNLDKLNGSGFVHVIMLATSPEALAKIKSLASVYPSVRVMGCKEFRKLTKRDILSR
jgi:hypothetical protein